MQYYLVLSQCLLMTWDHVTMDQNLESLVKRIKKCALSNNWPVTVYKI